MESEAISVVNTEAIQKNYPAKIAELLNFIVVNASYLSSIDFRTVMKRSLFYACLLFSFQTSGQAITGLNFSHWYNPQNEVSLQLNLVRETNQWMVHYQLKSLAPGVERYTITWEKRLSFSSRDVLSVNEKDSVTVSNANQRKGQLIFAPSPKPWLLLAKVVNNETQKAWYYYQFMDPIYPTSGWLEDENGWITDHFATFKKRYTLRNQSGKIIYVSFYNREFSAPLPPFSEKAIPTDQFLFHDSTFKIAPGGSFIPKRIGLYLFQQDTVTADGFALRVLDESYPKLAKIDDLIWPLLFITTPDEFKQLVGAKGDKPKFDKVILDITRDKDRARNFMRSYFQRVELANRYFSSFKEGWKTDRGMIYTVFGVPDEVSKNQGNEVWYYRGTNSRFTFVKAGSIYDADNYVLLRDKRFMEAWYSTIDLWRKSRF
jgi:GWxTD domain-containing protein